MQHDVVYGHCEEMAETIYSLNKGENVSNGKKEQLFLHIVDCESCKRLMEETAWRSFRECWCDGRFERALF